MKNPSLTKSSFLFSAGTMLSRVSGLIRDMVFVGTFGASGLHDAFVLAFRIPNLFRDMFAEGALGSSFTKVYAGLSREDPLKAKSLAQGSLYLCAIGATLLCALGIFLSGPLVHLMSQNLHHHHGPEFLAQTISLTQWLFPYLGMAMLGAILSGIMHQRGLFFHSAMGPIAFNLGNILGVLVLSPFFLWLSLRLGEGEQARAQLWGLAAGVLGGGLMQLAWQWHSVYRSSIADLKIKFWPLPWSDEQRQIFGLMLPAALAASIGPINIMVNTNFALSVGPGAVTWLNYAFRLLQLPIGVFGVAVGSAALPALARALHKDSGLEINTEARLAFHKAVELVVWLLAPSMIFIGGMSEAIIALLFQHGAFLAEDAKATALALSAYSLGMIPYGLIKVLTSLYFAMSRTRYAMIVAIIAAVINYLLNAALVKSYGHLGLALSSAVILSINAALLIWGLRNRGALGQWKDGLRLIGALLGAFVIALIWQRLCALVWTYLEFIPSVKLRALGPLALAGLGILVIFGGASLWRFQISPAAAKQLVLKRLKKS